MVDQAPRILAGRYEVGALIGRGGMAEVHIGHDTRLGRTVAIKILRSDLARDPAFQARFRREAQAAAALNYQAIVGVYDTGEDNIQDPATGTISHVPFIVMEYVEGHTVRDILRDGNAVPIDEAVEITIGVLSALDYSHRAGIVHRDIKPANVMLTPTGEVKVMDFGIARALADSAATMTQTQAVIGTAQYLSPEQARGEQVDARSDLYSTGCLLFELLTGRPPFTGDSPVSVAYQHVREEAPKPSSIASDVPPVLDQIVAKALAKNREERYATAAAFRADLEAALRGLPIQAAVPAEDRTQVLTPAIATPVTPAWNATGPVATTSATEQLYADPVEEDEEKSSKVWLWTLLSIAAVAIIAIVVILLLVNGGKKPEDIPETTAPLPDLIELTVDEARAKLLAEGFTDFDLATESEPSEEYESGLVIETDPPAGTDTDLDGATIVLTVSTGTNEALIPEVSGLDPERARELLEEAGLEPRTGGTENSPDVPKDRVTRTDPEQGQTLEKGTAVTYWTSTGRVTVEENYVGQNISDARAHLEDELRLVVLENEVETNEKKAGTVLKQSIEPGASVEQRSTITLDVAVEVQKIEVPDLAGWTEGAASDELVRLNLNFDPASRYAYSDTVAEGEVISTNPRAGRKVDPGTVVRLTVSRGQRPQTPVDPTDPGDTDPDPVDPGTGDDA